MNISEVKKVTVRIETHLDPLHVPRNIYVMGKRFKFNDKMISEVI